MADLAQLERALINADKAGDVEAAKTLAGEITRMRGAATPSTPVKIGRDAFPDTLREVLNSADWGTRNIAGAGTALRNLYEGGKQLLGRGDPQAIEEQRIIAQEAPIGAIAGNLAAFAPMAMIPGANTVAGGALAGAVTGAMQPTMEGESRLANTAIGGVTGAAIPAAIRAGKTIKAAAIDPFTEAGRTRIAGGLLNRTAGDAKAAAARMASAQGATPGFVPTAGQAADDAGIAALERATRAAAPGAFDAADKAQRQALAGAVRGVAKDDIARKAAVAARESAVSPLYDAAKRAVVEGDATIEELLKRPTIRSGLQQAEQIAGDEGRMFALTPSKPGATQWIDEVGNVVPAPPSVPKPENMRNLINEIIESGGISRGELADMGIDAAARTRPGLFRRDSGMNADDLAMWMEQRGWLNPAQIDQANKQATGGAHDLARRWVKDAMSGEPVFHPSQDDLAYEFSKKLADWGNQYGTLQKQTLPPTPASYSGQALHDLKMGIDKAITEGSPGIGNRIAGSQLTAKEAYLNWLESKIPEYGQAKSTFANLSKPINQMDIGQEFEKRLIPSLYRDMDAPQQLNAQAYARALMDQGDDIARSVTGMKGANLSKVMEPDQLQALQGVASDLQRMKVAENAGRGVGSDTVQKTAMSHIAAQAGIPNWMQSIARVPGGWAKRLGDAVYGSSDDQVRLMMAELLQNPQEASKAMEAAGVNPSMLAKLLSQGAQGAGFAAIPASINR